jgi:hypothetical protein
VIVEGSNREQFPQLEFRRRLLMNLLDTQNFSKLQQITVESNMSGHQNLFLLIYELKGETRLNRKVLDLSLAGKRVKFPIERMVHVGSD